jgi:tetratricopeptide (TPR) repeat protein
MAEIKNTQVEAAQKVNDDAAKIMYQAKGFWDKFSKTIIYVGGAIIILAGAYLGYKKFISEPNEEKANEAIWRAQNYFEKDSVNLALNGDGRSMGFEKITKNFSGTKAGNLSSFYAGLCYLKLGNPTKAVTFLKDFSSDGKQLQAIAYERLADAYADLNKQADAISYYEKASNYFTEDEGTSSEALFRAAQLSEVMQKNDDAIKYYKDLKEKFPKTEHGAQADKYLARLGVIN